MTYEEMFQDSEFPKLNKTVEVNDFVVNKVQIDDIVPCSVGVVKACKEQHSVVLFIGKNVEKRILVQSVIPINIYKTGKPQETDKQPYTYKICNLCHILKVQSDDFDYNQNDKFGRQTTRPSCKSCRVDIDGKSLKATEKRRMELIKPKDYELFTCPICGKRSIPGVTCSIVIDHDHRTGNAREWICDSCNTGIGRFKDDITILEKIISYINKHLEE